MSDTLTIQELAHRLAAVEAIVGITAPAPGQSWRDAVGIFTDTEFHARVIAEGAAIREADREAGRNGVEDEE